MKSIVGLVSCFSIILAFWVGIINGQANRFTDPAQEKELTETEPVAEQAAINPESKHEPFVAPMLASADSIKQKPSVKQNSDRSGTLRAHWKEGLYLTSADKTFYLKFGGLLLNDWAFIYGDRNEETGWSEDGTEFRAARLSLSGSIYTTVEFKVDYDFAGGKVSFKDLYLGLRSLPIISNIRVGHFNEPFGLEELTSIKHISLPERALTSALTPSRNLGIMFHGRALYKRINWAAGVFREDNSTGKSVGNGEYNYTGRLAGVPVFQGNERLLHIGVAYSVRSPSDDIVRYQQRPEVHMTLSAVDTDELIVDRVYLAGAEAAFVYGPVSAQAEVINASLDLPDQDNGSLSAYYVMGSFFPTGEHRNYKRSCGTFSRVRPKVNFNPPKGHWGAFEIVARYSHLDLDDEKADIVGGTLSNLSVGANWYLNPNTRVMMNYVIANVQDAGGGDIFQTRFQIDF